MSNRGGHMASVVLLVAAGGFLAGSFGCEERVVGTRNDWVGSQYDTEPPTRSGQQEEQGFGEKMGQGVSNTGHFLFGWTGLMGEQETGHRGPRGEIGERDVDRSRVTPVEDAGSGY